MFTLHRLAATPPPTPERIDHPQMQATIEAPDSNALAAAIDGMSIEQLVELRRVAEAEIARLQAAIPLQLEAAQKAFAEHDADAVRAAFDSEAELTRRLAAEQSRLRL